MKFLLIMTLFNFDGHASIATAEYTDKGLCNKAAKRFIAVHEQTPARVKIKAFCVELK